MIIKKTEYTKPVEMLLLNQRYKDLGITLYQKPSWFKSLFKWLWG